MISDSVYIILVEEVIDNIRRWRVTAKFPKFIYVLPEKKLLGLSPNFPIHASVSDLQYIFPRLVHLFSCRRIGRVRRSSEGAAQLSRVRAAQ
jgi:hypothetical protein